MLDGQKTCNPATDVNTNYSLFSCGPQGCLLKDTTLVAIALNDQLLREEGGKLLG